MLHAAASMDPIIDDDGGDADDEGGGGGGWHADEQDAREAAINKAKKRIRTGAKAGAAMDAHDHQALARKASERVDKQGVRARDCLPASEVERAQRIRDRFMKKNMPFEADGRTKKKKDWVPVFQAAATTRTSSDHGPFFIHTKGLLDNAHEAKGNQYFCERVIHRDVALVDQPARFGTFVVSCPTWH